MSDEAIKWRYGFRLRDGRWLWPRGLYELDLDKARAACLRTFPFADMVGVEPLSIEPDVARWVCERGKGWRLDEWQAAVKVAAGMPRPVPPIVRADPAEPVEFRKPWWDRD